MSAVKAGRGRYCQIDNDIEETPTLSDYTPICQSSGTYPLFRVAALEFVDKLKDNDRPEARMMVAALMHYVNIFASWSPVNKPNEKERTRLVDEFLELCNDVNKFVGS